MPSRISWPLVLLLAAGLAQAQKKPVTLDAVAASWARTLAPAEIVWAPDGRSFAYELDKSVWLYDVPAKARRSLVSLSTLNAAATPVPAVQAFEWQNRGVKEQTIQWSPGGASLLLSAGDDLFLFRIAAGGWTQLTATAEAEHNPKLSPDGRRVSFRRAGDLYSLEISSRQLVRLTNDGSATLGNGRLDWVYPEELELGTAHWWSPDSRSVAYLQFDVSRQPLYPHADILASPPVFEPQRYPRAGEPNADVRLGVVPVGGGPTRWMDTGETRDALLARVHWAPDSRSLMVQRLNRVQNRLELLRADAATGRVSLTLREEDPYWINVGDYLRFLKNGAEFLLASERDGFRHLYRYSIEGKELARLTSGDWEVTGLAGVDEPAGEVFFLSTEASPLERHLYSVKLEGGERRRITSAAGTHAVSMAPGCEYYLDTFSSLQSPTRKAVFKAGGAEWAQFVEDDRKLLEEYSLRPVEIVEVKASDGTVLYARLIRPAGFRPGRKYPAVVFIYGGPHSQNVRNAWEGLNLEQALAYRGFVIWQLDNRGSGGRGHRWESVLFRGFGAKELEDQKEGIRRLVSMGFVDASRLGIYGSSYGGFMTLYSLINAPGLFRAGVAGAPVTDWSNYDTIYTERYLGLPSENADGYRRSSPIHYAAGIKVPLLLIHNLEDDNVLFRNTLQMADALQREGKPFEMMVYPQKTHSVTGEARKHMLETVAAFFERQLKR
jgi:dipeptidyl-peptidase-4